MDTTGKRITEGKGGRAPGMALSSAAPHARSMRTTLRKLKLGEKGRKGLLAIALAFGLVAMAGRGEAVPISSYTGNSFLSSGTMDGTVNFAVYRSFDFSADAAGILSSFTAGSGSGALDLGPGINVYVFQVTNSGSIASTITQFSAGRNSSSSVDVTSWGYVSGAVFKDAEGNVSGTNALNTGATSVQLVSDSGTNPSLVSKTSTSIFTTLSIAAGGTSSLIVYTSHSDPDWFSGQIGGGAMGPVPGAQVPEPGTLLLTTMGLAGLAGLRRRRGLHRKGGDG